MPLKGFCSHFPFLLLCVLLQVAVSGTESELTPIAQLRALSKETAAKATPVRVQGVVIASETHSFVIHDHEAGLFVECTPGVSLPEFGREVVVEGVTDPGEFAPIIRARHITPLGVREISPRVITQAEELETGRLDCRWVEVEGLLRSAQPYSATEPCFTAYAVLSTGVARINLSFSTTPFAEVQQWVGSRVRLRAACGHYFNSHGQLYGTRLIVPRSSEVTVLEKALPREEVPLTHVDALLRYSADESTPSRTQIRGTVTYLRGAHELYVQQEQRGVFVQRIDQTPLEIGDQVAVIGYVRRGLYSPELEDAEIQRLGGVARVAPRIVSPEEARTADGELVEVTGTVLDHYRNADAHVLTLKGEGGTFTAVLPGQKSARALPLAGSRVRMIGVARAIETPAIGAAYPWTPSSFELRLRDEGDLAVVAKPPGSAAVWVFGGATFLSSLALLVAGTLWWKSKAKLREQKRKRIMREAEFAAMMKERMRLAREIHDSLAQGFTAVSIQLEMAKHKLPGDANAVLDHLEAARSLVRESLTAARQSIHDLRQGLLSNTEFGAALQRISDTLLRDTGIVFRAELKGELSRLGVDAENELLRILSEAMTNTVKHARAKTIVVQYLESEQSGELSVTDDGVGLPADAAAAGGFGLRGMRERAQRLNGQLHLHGAPGGGTRVVVRLPLLG